MMNERTKGPFIVWKNYGYEGWQPDSFDSLKEALESEKYSYEWIITKIAQYTVVDNTK